MFGNVNKVQLIGRLGQDPEVRSTNAGKKVASLSIATSVFWQDEKTKERKERTEWHRVIVFNPRFVGLVEAIAQKGAHVVIEGSLQTRKWQDKDGKDRFTTEVVIQPYAGDFQVISGGKKVSQTEAGDPGYAPDEEIPFT
jgi:single-strand DNA-binding protein